VVRAFWPIPTLGIDSEDGVVVIEARSIDAHGRSRVEFRCLTFEVTCPRRQDL
jgi:hypothetical protein